MPRKKLTEHLACDEIVILDFETTGLSSNYDRVIEVGAVLVKKHKIVDEFVELMNPGITLSSFITSLTGITNAMLKGKPKPESVMPRLLSFIEGRPIVAHNATFDKRFLLAELNRANISAQNPFICTMRLAKKLIPDAISYKLANISKHVGIRVNHSTTHRALSDVKITAKLWKHLHAEVIKYTGTSAPTIETLTKVATKAIIIK